MGGRCRSPGEPHARRAAEGGVAVADIYTGLYATIAILAALTPARATGEGQSYRHGVARCPGRRARQPGDELPDLGQGAAAPRQRPSQHRALSVFPAADGHVIIAVGNDGQWRKLCEVVGDAGFASDPRYVDNRSRVANRVALTARSTR
jgi:crotonobetainyl-CoA:carnitine CoA-transferase CaiB-like acyl-CoA transferase